MCVLNRCNKHPAELSSPLSPSSSLPPSTSLLYISLSHYVVCRASLSLSLSQALLKAALASCASLGELLLSLFDQLLSCLAHCHTPVCVCVFVLSLSLSPHSVPVGKHARSLSRSRSGDVHQKLTDSRRYKTCVSHNLIVNIVFGKSPSMGDARLWNCWNKNKKKKELNFWGYCGIKALGLPPSKLICSKVRTCIRRKPSTTKGARERID